MTPLNLRLLDAENALTLLPIPPSCLQEIDDALVEINQGARSGVVKIIDRLVQINKQTRFNTKSWSCLKQAAVLNLELAPFHGHFPLQPVCVLTKT